MWDFQLKWWSIITPGREGDDPAVSCHIWPGSGLQPTHDGVVDKNKAPNLWEEKEWGLWDTGTQECTEVRGNKGSPAQSWDGMTVAVWEGWIVFSLWQEAVMTRVIVNKGKMQDIFHHNSIIYVSVRFQVGNAVTLLYFSAFWFMQIFNRSHHVQWVSSVVWITFLTWNIELHPTLSYMFLVAVGSNFS